MGQLMDLPIEKVRESSNSLRTVDRQSSDFIELVASIAANGVINPISVRRGVGDDGGEAFFVVDGLQRYTASKDAGLSTIPANVLDVTEAKVLELQIIGNVQKIETKPVEYTRGMQRILVLNPLLTLSELGLKLNKSATWISERLGLLKLSDDIAKLVDEGSVNLSNAYALAKLPIEEQTNFLSAAMTQTPQEFVPSIQARIKEIRDARRKGSSPEESQFVPVAHLQKISSIKSEMDNLSVVGAAIDNAGVSSPAEVAKITLAWVLHLDNTSIAEQRSKYDARQKAQADAKAKRESEREVKKLESASAKAEEIRKKLEEAKAKNS